MAANRKSNGYNTVLHALAPDGTELRYIGGIKFARRGDPVYFANDRHARTIGRQLKRKFPVLRPFKLSTR